MIAAAAWGPWGLLGVQHSSFPPRAPSSNPPSMRSAPVTSGDDGVAGNLVLGPIRCTPWFAWLLCCRTLPASTVLTHLLLSAHWGEVLSVLGTPVKPSPTSVPCRDYSLMFGGGALLVSFVPSFRNMRILSIIAILGTTYTSW